MLWHDVRTYQNQRSYVIAYWLRLQPHTTRPARVDGIKILTWTSRNGFDTRFDVQNLNLYECTAPTQSYFVYSASKRRPSGTKELAEQSQIRLPLVFSLSGSLSGYLSSSL